MTQPIATFLPALFAALATATLIESWQRHRARRLLVLHSLAGDIDPPAIHSESRRRRHADTGRTVSRTASILLLGAALAPWAILGALYLFGGPR